MSSEKGDEGFTLVELLVAITIMAIITAAIGSALVVSFKTTFSTARKLNVSNNAQLLSQYLVPDVLSAGLNGVDTSAGASPGCTGTPGTGMRLALTWTDARTSTAYAVSYQLVGSTLNRYSCSGGGSGVATIVARDVTSVPTPTVTGAAVSMTVTVDDSEDTTHGDAYTFTVQASRRVASNSCTPLAPSISLTGVPAAVNTATGKLTANVGVTFATTGICSTAPTVTYQYGATGVTGSVTATGGSGGSWSATVPATAPGSWTVGTAKSLTITAAAGTVATTFIVYDPNACRLTAGPTTTPSNSTYVGTTLVTPIVVSFQTQGTCGSTGSVAYQYGATGSDSTSVPATPVAAAGTTTWTATIQSTPVGTAWTAGTKIYSAAADTASATGSFTVAAATSLCAVTSVSLSGGGTAALALGYGTSGPLSGAVTATVTSSATCTASDISVTYQYGGSSATSTATVTGSGTTWTATLPATAAGDWTTGAKPVTASAGNSASATLTVNESCGLTTAIALNPQTSGRKSNGKDLSQDIQASFTTTGSCASTQLSLVYDYDGSHTGTVTFGASSSTTNADGTKSWLGTIPGNLTGSAQWTAGTHPVTVTLGAVVKTTNLVVT